MFTRQEVIGIVKKRFILNFGKSDGDEEDEIAEGIYGMDFNLGEVDI